MELQEWRRRVEIVLTIIVIMALLLWKASCNDKAKEKANVQAKTALSQPQIVATKLFTDKAGDTHKQIPATINQVKQSSLKDTAVTNKTLLDSMAKQLSIKDEQINELTRMNLQLNEMVQLAPTDSADVFNYNDGHLNLTYFSLFNKAEVNYHVNISAVKFTPASFLPFSSKPALLDISTDDPRATIGNIDHNTIITQPAFVGFSAYAKAYYSLDNKTITPEIEANLRLGRWHLLGAYYYDNTLKKSVGAAYDLIKINP